MKKRIISLLFVVFIPSLLTISGCTSNGYIGRTQVADLNYMNKVNKAAHQSQTKVIWINPPQKKPNRE